MAKKIILIHGLGGTADGTWGKFPTLLAQDNDIEYEILCLGYETNMPELLKPCTWGNVFKRSPGILNIANGLLTDIQSKCDIANDEIIIAGHSLGGVILKKLLLILKNKNIVHKISKVCFFDVPHDGSGYANLGKHIIRRNRHLLSLTRDSGELDDLTEQWINSGLNNTLDIISIIAANDDIVSSSSSKSIFREHDVKTINGANHSSIVKPDSYESSSYIVFKSFILKKNTVYRYRNLASRNLEDWKNVERNHAYHYATDEIRENNLSALKDALGQQRSVVRLTGASGLGKTRLLLEVIDSMPLIDGTDVLMFDAPGYDTLIKESVRKMVEDCVHGIIIIENCSVDLHNFVSKEVQKNECFIKVITIGYSDEQVDDSIHIKLSPLSNKAIKQILSPILVEMSSNDVERVARFAQGYPLMATLIAEQYQKEGKLLGSIEKSSVVRKLIDSDGDITSEERGVLSACSLFDVFGTSEGTAGEEAKYIAEVVAGSNLRVFDRVLKIFTSRQIINRAGRYARLVPKPLALTLASEWWEEASYDRQQELINTLPDSLMQSFCTQAAYLDTQPSVQKFSEQLFGGSSPFVQADVLITERGSRLFRAFVEVNPESTSRALYKLLCSCNHAQLKSIDKETRRNLVWGLEKLCFHEHIFERAAWCMLLLASAENEKWSNNSTGMFSQLFRVRLSGTQAQPETRFSLLNRAIEVRKENFDIVILEALSQAITISGNSRSVGAEYQGTKVPLEEWKPKTWQDIYDYWQKSIDLMLSLMGKGEKQNEMILLSIGNSIRGFVRHGRLEMLDVAIRKIISLNGCYWPSALNSIKTCLKYDSEKLDKDSLCIINDWLELLNPENSELKDKLKILISNPIHEYSKDRFGNYNDIAEEKAKTLAVELSNNIEIIFPHINSLLLGEQKQSYAFGCQLAKSVDNIQPLIDLSVFHLKIIEYPNYKFIQGLYRGLFERSEDLWHINIDKLSSDENLAIYYPDLIRTGKIQKKHLNKIFELIKNNVINYNNINVLSYGNATSDIEPETISNFCLQLSQLDEHANWPALNIMYMYCFNSPEKIEALRTPLKLLVASVPLYNEQKDSVSDAYHWYDLAGKLLAVKDIDFAISLTQQIISASKHSIEHGTIWSYIKPLLTTLMHDFSENLWPLFADAIINSERMQRYWLKELLDRESSTVNNMPSVLAEVSVDTIINWCKQHPEIGPVFIACCLNIFEEVEGKNKPTALFIALLEHFGHIESVANELKGNMMSRGWSGSLVPYLESDKKALLPLQEHDNYNVRHWASEQIVYIDSQISEESQRDEENNFNFY
ncbi:hypothetical protein [Enterobacter hormaechei]|uniref:hypothetical protein n=1 Tax=Enterobacter hormaechei TaxID=158836 RepID=UPI000D372E0C|nr:hypothetical protein [Enterobacter hormaechei]